MVVGNVHRTSAYGIMQRKIQFGFAILAMGFLLLSPSGSCLSMPIAPTHPCCPTAPIAPEDCAKTGCVCINSLPILIAVPTNSGAMPIVLPAKAGPHVGQVAASERPTFELALAAPHGRYLSFHQLLL